MSSWVAFGASGAPPDAQTKVYLEALRKNTFQHATEVPKPGTIITRGSIRQRFELDTLSRKYMLFIL